MIAVNWKISDGARKTSSTRSRGSSGPPWAGCRAILRRSRLRDHPATQPTLRLSGLDRGAGRL